MRTRTTFLGRTSLGPDEVSPAIPVDSPRIPENRYTCAAEADADRTLSRLTDKLVADEHGHRFVQPRTARLKPGQRILGSAPARRVVKDTWKLPDGTIATHPASCRVRLAKKPGWMRIADAEVARDLADPDLPPELREHLEVQLEHQSRDANAPRQRTGRKMVDGEVVRTFDGDDSPVAVPHDKRTTMAKLSESVKPKDGEP